MRIHGETLRICIECCTQMTAAHRAWNPLETHRRERYTAYCDKRSGSLVHADSARTTKRASSVRTLQRSIPSYGLFHSSLSMYTRLRRWAQDVKRGPGRVCRLALICGSSAFRALVLTSSLLTQWTWRALIRCIAWLFKNSCNKDVSALSQ
jgi:hypothetical protein